MPDAASPTLAAVAAKAAERAEIETELDDAMRAARAAGDSVAAIARAAGFTRQTVYDRTA